MLQLSSSSSDHPPGAPCAASSPCSGRERHRPYTSARGRSRFSPSPAPLPGEPLEVELHCRLSARQTAKHGHPKACECIQGSFIITDRFEKSPFSPSTAGFQDLRYSAHLDKLWCRTSQSPPGLPAGKPFEFPFQSKKLMTSYRMPPSKTAKSP